MSAFGQKNKKKYVCEKLEHPFLILGILQQRNVTIKQILF
jgi:hypothetical protein